MTATETAVESAMVSDGGPKPATLKGARRWLGPRGGWWILLIGAVILAAYLTYDAIVAPSTTSYRSLPVTSLALGAILAATALFYTMAYRVRAEDDVNIGRLFAALGIAGFVTTFAAALIENQLAHWVGSTPSLAHSGQATTVLTLFAGPVEETLKGLTVLLLGIGVRVKTMRGGLFLGGAVGLGFAAVEDLQYLVHAWEYPAAHFSQLGSLAFSIGLRTIITPLLHPIFTALIGGMLFAASRNGRYRLSAPLVGTFFAVVGVHSLWDAISPAIGSLRYHVPVEAYGLLALLVLAVEGGIGIGMPFIWWAVAKHAAVLAGLRAPKPARPAPPYYFPPGPPPPAGWVAPGTNAAATKEPTP